MRADFQIELLFLGTIFCLGLGTIASMKPAQKWRIPSSFSDGERWIRTLGSAPDRHRFETFRRLHDGPRLQDSRFSTRNREILWGGRRGNGNFVAASNDGVPLCPS